MSKLRAQVLDELTELTQDIEQPRSTMEDVLDTRTPEEIEKEYLDAANKQALDSANKMMPEEIAAFYFQNHVPMFNNLIKDLSNKDAKRLAKALVQWPLVEENPAFSSDKAKQALWLGLNLLDAKQIMKSVIEYEKFQEIHNQKVNAENLAAEATVDVIHNEQGEK